MSSSLVWKPETSYKGSLPYDLKCALTKRFNFDGGGRVFNGSDNSYLQGLADAGIDGAAKLMDLIQKHEEVRVWLEY